MAGKKVITKNHSFDTLTKAKEHFDSLRKNAPLDQPISDPDRSEILDIYERYCQKTDHNNNFVPVDVVVTISKGEHNNGSFAQTKAFAVISQSNEKEIFSISKALSAIAE